MIKRAYPLAAGLAAVTALSMMAPAQAAFPGRNGRVVVGTNLGTMFTLNVHGDDRRSLGLGQGPTYSADGTKLAFFLTGDIWVMNANGSNRHRVTSGTAKDVNPAWSPDGKKIVFSRAARADEKLRSLALVTLATGAVKNLTATDDGCAFDPSWTANGRFVVYDDYCSTRTPNGDNAYRKVEVATGRVTTIITSSGIRAGGVRITPYGRPLPTPDGTRIVWTGQNQSDYEYSYVVTDLDGTGSRVFGGDSPDYSQSFDALSPDGKTVIKGTGSETSQISSSCLVVGCQSFGYLFPGASDEYPYRMDWQPLP